MTNLKPAAVELPDKGFALHWADGPDVKQLLTDEALIQVTGDRVYVTLGQIQVPTTIVVGPKPESLEIEPVARLVFTIASYHKIAAALKSISDQIRKAPAKTEEVAR